MKRDILARRADIARRIKSRGGAVVLLDFDGTLAPIVSVPKKARMSARMRRALAAYARRFPVAVVTGRAFADVRKRVRVRGVSFAGNHGLEWSIRGKRSEVALSAQPARALAKVKKLLDTITARYRGAFVEDKKHSLAVHYRHVRASRHSAFLREARKIVHDTGGKHLRTIPGILILNILPNVGWDKGKAARMMYTQLRTSRASVPVFVGDDATDEDVFKALRRGITVKVLSSGGKKSYAHYALDDLRAVEKFLVWLACI